MGRTIYFTEKELHALRDTSSEWLDMMGDGDEESIKCVEDRLDEGLGSALFKLFKGLNGERIYREYAKNKNKS